MSLMAYCVGGSVPTLSTRSDLEASVACKIQYLNEGGANFVFKLSGIDDSEPPTQFQRKLLRLRKNLSHAQHAAEQLKALDQNFKPLFSQENLIQHDVVRLDHGFAEALNIALRKLVRPSHRLQDFLPEDEQHGMLITDMTTQADDTVIELKPKWLAQSPNAPSGSKRCRTCALRAQRTSKKIRTATDAQESCPLELIHEDIASRQRAATRLTNDGLLADFLTNDAQPLFATLRSQQQALNPAGVLGVSKPEAIYDLCRAMTLRDCTLFVKQSRGSIEARLGDLDLKQPEKLGKWKQAERSLIEEGWYANNESRGVWREEAICVLSW